MRHIHTLTKKKKHQTSQYCCYMFLLSTRFMHLKYTFYGFPLSPNTFIHINPFLKLIKHKLSHIFPFLAPHMILPHTPTKYRIICMNRRNGVGFCAAKLTRKTSMLFWWLGDRVGYHIPDFTMLFCFSTSRLKGVSVCLVR